MKASRILFSKDAYTQRSGTLDVTTGCCTLREVPLVKVKEKLQSGVAAVTAALFANDRVGTAVCSQVGSNKNQPTQCHVVSIQRVSLKTIKKPPSRFKLPLRYPRLCRRMYLDNVFKGRIRSATRSMCSFKSSRVNPGAHNDDDRIPNLALHHCFVRTTPAYARCPTTKQRSKRKPWAGRQDRPTSKWDRFHILGTSKPNPLTAKPQASKCAPSLKIPGYVAACMPQKSVETGRTSFQMLHTPH